MVFSNNQVRQLYVVKATGAVNTLEAASTQAGTAAIVIEGGKFYLVHKGHGGVTRTPIVEKATMEAKYTPAVKMQVPLKTQTITLNGDINGGVPVAGQDYILRIMFQGFYCPSVDSFEIKYGMVHAYANMTKSTFYKTLALSLAKNFSKDKGLLNFALTIEDEDDVPVTATTNADSLTENYDGVKIIEVEQDWTLGKYSLQPVDFTCQPDEIFFNGDARIWGEVAKGTEGVINNGKTIADLEYFCMGARGDKYRGMGYPDNIETKLLVDPTVEYDVFDIHHATIGANEDIQKSEQDLTLVVPKTATTVVSALKNALGI